MGTLIDPFEAMRSLCHLVFLVFFASLHPSLGVTLLGKCCTSPVAGPGFELWEGNVVGRGFKTFDNYTVCRCKRACLAEEKCRSYEFSPTEKRCNLNKEHKPQILEASLGTT